MASHLAYTNKYNTSAKDKGLENVFEEARLPSDLRTLLTDPTGITQWATSEDLYYGFGMSQEAVTEQIDITLSNYAKYRKPRATDPPNHEFTRTRAKLLKCWNVCRELVRIMTDTPPDAEVDLETPLSSHVQEELHQNFLARYHLTILPDYSPDEATITRYYRGLQRKKCAIKVFDMKTHRALGKTNGVAPEGGVINNIHQYWKHARIMAYSLAMAGNFPFTCAKKGSVEVHAPLDVNMNYVDWAYDRALSMNSLPWLKERDEYTRTLMVSYLRAGYSQGTALEQALADTTFEWKDSRSFKARDRPIQGAGAAANSPTGIPTPGTGAGGAGGEGGGGGARLWQGAVRQARKRRRKGSQQPPGAAAGGNTAARVDTRPPPPPPPPRQTGGQRNEQKTAELGPGGRKLCRAWGTGKCYDRNCQQMHNYCSRRLVGGGVCGLNHPQFKCNNNKRMK
jgi:hypothetical protein